MSIQSQLTIGLAALNIDLKEHQQKQLLDYLDLLQKWNKAFNLSGVKDAASMVGRHLLDSLTLYPFIAEACKRTEQPLRIIDVGTGPGLPGIPLAICFPQADFVLLDSNGKKTRFVFQARLALDLTNVSVENCRIEHYQSPEQIDIVVSRAFSTLAEMVQQTTHLQHQHSVTSMRWLAMKGSYPDKEIAALPNYVELLQARSVTVPGDQADRHIIEMIAVQTRGKGE